MGLHSVLRSRFLIISSSFSCAGDVKSQHEDTVKSLLNSYAPHSPKGREARGRQWDSQVSGFRLGRAQVPGLDDPTLGGVDVALILDLLDTDLDALFCEYDVLVTHTLGRGLANFGDA
jgi:hypothetical protein